MACKPRYLKMTKKKIQERIELLTEIIRECRLCPRECKVKRLEGELGFCKAGRELMISSVFPHFGEEQPLVGSKGSGGVLKKSRNMWLHDNNIV